MGNMGEWLTTVTARCELGYIETSQNSDGKKMCKKGKENILRAEMIGTAGMED